jgi:uncharacterized protein DUF5681
VNPPPDEYEVGYGRPPRETRWKKGQSGNSRPRKAKRLESTVEIIDGLLTAPVKITLNGEPTKVSALEAIVVQLILKQMSGNGQAARILLKFQEFGSRNGRKELELTFIENEYTKAFASSPSEADHVG